MGGESHGNGTETARPVISNDATEQGGLNPPVREVRPARDNSQSVGTGYDETVNPCGCKPEQGKRVAQYLPR